MTDWEQRYQKGQTGWERGGLHPFARAVKAKSGLMIVPGAGRGPEPLYFARQGLEVEIVDIAPSAIDAQAMAFKTAGLSGSFNLTDILTWQPERPADFVYEQTCLCAIQPAERAAYEAQVHSWLKPGGQLFANFMQKPETGGPPFDCPVEEMKQLFSQARWSWPDTRPVRTDHNPPLYELGYILTRR